jgi:hypothetical protein
VAEHGPAPGRFEFYHTPTDPYFARVRTARWDNRWRVESLNSTSYHEAIAISQRDAGCARRYAHRHGRR